MKIWPALLAMLVVAVVVAPAAAARTDATAPATRYVDDVFGPILATHSKKALYYWNVEERAGGKVRCTGPCARAWPPLYAKGVVPTRVRGIRGTFGTIRRRDGRRQVTFNRLPVYTYAHERPGQVLCDDVDGWFVVRLR